MTGAQTTAALMCIFGLVVAVVGLAAGPSHGTGYWCLALLWKAGWLIVLLRSRRRARPSHPGHCSEYSRSR